MSFVHGDLNIHMKPYDNPGNITYLYKLLDTFHEMHVSLLGNGHIALFQKSKSSSNHSWLFIIQ